jgi:hypothetical protein
MMLLLSHKRSSVVTACVELAIYIYIYIVYLKHTNMEVIFPLVCRVHGIC